MTPRGVISVDYSILGRGETNVSMSLDGMNCKRLLIYSGSDKVEGKEAL